MGIHVCHPTAGARRYQQHSPANRRLQFEAVNKKPAYHGQQNHLTQEGHEDGARLTTDPPKIVSRQFRSDHRHRDKHESRNANIDDRFQQVSIPKTENLAARNDCRAICPVGLRVSTYFIGHELVFNRA